MSIKTSMKIQDRRRKPAMKEGRRVVYSADEAMDCWKSGTPYHAENTDGPDWLKMIVEDCGADSPADGDRRRILYSPPPSFSGNNPVEHIEELRGGLWEMIEHSNF